MSETGNRLLDAFRRRRPDVDVVVLPPEPSLAFLELSEPAEVAGAAAATRAAAASLVEEVDAPGPPTVVERWNRLEPHVHRHRTRLRLDLSDTTSALEAILEVLDSLTAAGWDPRPVDAPTPWLVARSPLACARMLTADVALHGLTLVVTVESAPLRLEEAPS